MRLGPLPYTGSPGLGLRPVLHPEGLLLQSAAAAVSLLLPRWNSSGISYNVCARHSIYSGHVVAQLTRPIVFISFNAGIVQDAAVPTAVCLHYMHTACHIL